MKGKLLKGLVVLAGLFMLTAPNVLAVECAADIDCDEEVGLFDLILMKNEYGTSGCDPSPQCPLCEGTQSPLGRWCDQGDGTVKDMTTGLVWLKKADWGGQYPLWDDFGDPDAHHRAAELWDGSPYEGTAGLSDGSVEGDWRLPTKTELVGITVGDEYIRYNQMYYFTGVQSYYYWSGTSYAVDPYYAWFVYMYNGYVLLDSKGRPLYVWPVRSDN